MVFRGEIAGKVNMGETIVHNLRFGADWDKFEIDSFQTRYRPVAADQSYSIDIFNPNYNIVAPTPTAVILNTLEVQKAWGIYAQDQIEIGEMFKVRIGGRYDDFRPDIALRSTNTSVSAKYTKFSPMAGLVFEPTKSLSFYASYGKGFRPNSGTDFAGNLFQPETSESYEVGAKFVTTDGRFTSTLSLFTMTKDGVLTADPANAGFSRPAGSAKSKGIEFDLNAKLPAGFELFLTYAYTDAEWSTTARDPNFGFLISAGDPLINIPKHQGNALLFKTFSVGNTEAMLGAGVSHVGRRLGETATTFFLPAYTIAKVMGSINVTEQIKLSADVSNIFDKKYYASSYAALWIQPGMPRAFTVRASFNF